MSDVPNGEREWTSEELQQVLSYFLRHVVGFALTYGRRMKDGKLAADGELEAEDQFAFYSAFVISIGEQWWLVTAGHIMRDEKPKIENPAVVVKGRSLVDYFGMGAKHHQPIPFDLFGEPAIHIYDKLLCLDFALVPIGELCRKNLEANGILPLPINWKREGKYEDFYGFGVVGFPGEYSTPVEMNKPQQAGGQVRPVLVPLRRDDVPPKKGQAPRFVGRILDMGNQKSIVGMSGGPIFGYRQNANEESEYEVIAIQSSWNDKDTIYGCPLFVVFKVIQAALEKAAQ